MHALYNGWAKEFQNPNLKLYFVQLTPWGSPNIPYIQEAQAQFDAEQPNAGMAVINDVGNLSDIHPNDKRTVAKRLAIHALRRDYGYGSLRDNSPTLKGWKVEGNKFRLTFNDAEGWYVVRLQSRPQRPDRLRDRRGGRQVRSREDREPCIRQGPRRQAEVRRQHPGR